MALIGPKTVFGIFTCIAGGLTYLQSPSDNLEKYLREKPQETAPTWNNADTIPPDAREFIKEYAPAILAAGEKYDVPPEFIAGAIVHENAGRIKLDDLKDALAFDPSLGPGQITVSTALAVGPHYGIKKKKEDLVLLLKDNPVENIDYIAMTFADRIHRPNRISRDENGLDIPLLSHPYLISVLATEYVGVPTETPLYKRNPSDIVAKPSDEGLQFARDIANVPSIALFGKTPGRITVDEQNALRRYAENELVAKRPSSWECKAVPQFCGHIYQ